MGMIEKLLSEILILYVWLNKKLFSQVANCTRDDNSIFSSNYCNLEYKLFFLSVVQFF